MAQVKNVEAWCMRMTKNLSIDKLRSKHKKVAQLSDAIIIKEKTANPHQATEMNDTISQVEKLMEALPEKQRMVMQLRDIEGMQYQEIADILQISMEQVKVNLFRARKQIRTQLINTESYGI